MTGDNITSDIVGGPAGHVPVMLDEVLSVLQPSPGKIIVDGTFGAGGYTSAILDRGAAVVAIDRDPDAIREGGTLEKSSAGLLTLEQGKFSELDRIARMKSIEAVDGVVLDIGVSSMQLDQSARGFSFRHDGPLDMRMSQKGISAEVAVNSLDGKDLTRIIGLLGEERRASAVSRAIVDARQKSPITTTGQLSAIVEKALGRRTGEKIHPATRTFQALRIFINQELEELANALFAAERLLRAGGRLVVVTFHSLEDRIVKLFLRGGSQQARGSRHLPEKQLSDATFNCPQRGAVKASEHESKSNPRARSAKMRWGERTDAPAREKDLSLFKLPSLASLDGLSAEGSA